MKTILLVLSVSGLQWGWFWINQYAQSAANRHLGFGHPRFGPDTVFVLVLALSIVVGLAVKGRRTESLAVRIACVFGALTTTGWCLHLLTIGCEGCRAAG